MLTTIKKYVLLINILLINSVYTCIICICAFLCKEKIKKELEKASSVIAVSDCWTSRAQDAYLTVSAHYLDENWKPKSVCLATQEADERHSAENLCVRITEIINEYEIGSKITTVVTDNAANAVNSVEMMECVDEVIDVQCAPIPCS